MNNNLQKSEKSLRSIAKRYENVKYSVGLAVLFLMKGTSAFSDNNMIQEAERQKDILTDAKKQKSEVKEKKVVVKDKQKLKASWATMQFGANDLYSNFFVTPKNKVEKTSIVKSEKTVLVASADNSVSLPMFAKLSSDIGESKTPTTEEITASKGNLRASIGNLQEKIDTARRENQKEIDGLRLELIQLMEQGNQVVKSPWSSWQFGANYTYDNWGSSYKGKGDKKEKYPYDGKFQRADWWTASVSENSKNYKNLTTSADPYSAATTLRGALGEINYGFIKRTKIQEKPVEMKLQAGVTPRIVKFIPLNIEVPSASLGASLNIPNLDIPVFSPQEPSVQSPTITSPPNLTYRPTGFGQGWEPNFASSSIILENYDFYDTDGLVTIDDTTGFTGTIKYKETNDPAYNVVNSNNGGFYDAFLSDAHDGDVEIKGNYKMTISDIQGSKYFLSLNPYEVRKRREYKFSGDLEIYSQITNNDGAAIAFEHQLLSYGPGGYGYDSVGNNGGSSSDPHQPDAQSVFINEGNVKLASGRNMVGIVIDTEGTQFLKQAETINRGKIEIGENASESLGIDFGSYLDYQPHVKVHLGNIVVNGKKSYAFRLQTQTDLDYYKQAQVYGGDDRGNESKLEIYGEENVGVSVSQNINNDPSDTDKNAIEEFHNLNILVGGKKNVGLLRRADYQTTQTNNLILNNNTIKDIAFDKSADSGVLVRTDKYKIVSQKDITTMAEGNNNIVYFANGADAIVENNAKITIEKSGKDDNNSVRLIGMIANNKGKIIADNSTIINKEIRSIGMATIDTHSALGTTPKTEGTLLNSTITMTGPKSVGVYNEHSKFSVDKSTISVSGESSIAVYNKSIEPVNINKSTINANTGAIALYPTKYSNNIVSGKYTDKSEINIKDTTINVGDRGLFFYSYTNETGHEKEILGKVKLDTGNKLTVNKDGVAFYNRGKIDGIRSYLNFLEGVTATETLNLTLENGGRLFVLEDSGNIFNLSDLPTAGVQTLTNLANNAKVQVTIAPGAKYKYYTANGGTLNVDTDVDLSNELDNYFKNDIMSANVNVIKPMTNNGGAIADGTKYAVAQKNSDPTNINKVIVNVNAPITLTNIAGLVGVAVDAGKIINNDKITVTGDNGIGLLGAHKTEMTNNKDIIIGNNGIGILGLNKLTPTSQADGFKITQAANSKIKYAGNGKSAFGVVALNNDGTSTTYSSDVTLGANSQIDFSNTVGGIGVLLRGTKINFTDNGSIIKVGKQGRGIFIEDNSTSATDAFTLAINGGKVEAFGDNAIGIYSTKALSSAKEVDIQGKKAAGYYAKENLTLLPNANITVQDSTGGNNDRTIGVFAEKGVDVQSKINVGKSSIGIYKKEGASVDNIQFAPSSEVTIKDGGVGLYAEKANITINSATKFDTGNNKAIGVYAVKGSTVNNTSINYSIGNSSLGFVTENSIYNGGTETATLNNDDSIFLYAKNSTVSNIGAISGNGNKSVGVYGVNSNITSTNNIDLSSGKGNIGIYGEGAGKTITSTGNITVGESILDPTDDSKSFYSIGIAGDKGVRINSNAGGNITLKGNNSIGIYGTGNGTVIDNHKDIIFAPTGKVDRMIGLFVNDGAKAVNYGNIYTASNYSGNSNVKGLVGVAVVKGTLENHGNITIDADGSFGMIVNNSVIKNYGTIRVNGKDSVGALYDTATKGATGKNDPSDYNTGGGSIIATGTGASNYKTSYNPDKTMPTSDNTEIKMENGKLVVKRNGKVVPDALVNTPGPQNNLWFSNVGLYIDTLGRTNPIQGTGFNSSKVNDLIIGAEAADVTNSKNIRVGKNIMQRFINWSSTNAVSSLDIYSGSLTWSASYDANTGEAVMAKIDYKDYVNKDQNEYNFLDGLEQRYDMNALDSREKTLFNKINSIQKNEGVLLSQAFDEMMGHQYANTQQRIVATGNILDKEFNYLRSEWQNVSKDSNKIKTFGTRGEYSTDTAGIIDYKNNAYGVAYVHEDETVRLGESVGWYAGIVHNTFRFKDIGNSKEEMLQGKFGIFKSIPFDYNNSLNWTISGDIFAGYNKMHRKFLVVDEIFSAKSRYHTYGLGIKNELGKEFRLSESFTFRPYAALGLEYGRVSKISEKSGEIKLDVKANDYFSVKPEIGAELAYRHHFGSGAVKVAVGVAYENELGRVANGKNQAKVSGTTADYFNIRGEKEDRRGNVKTDLNIGWDNQRVGVTANVGYDTKGHNVRAGVGLRVIF